MNFFEQKWTIRRAKKEIKRLCEKGRGKRSLEEMVHLGMLLQAIILYEMFHKRPRGEQLL